MTVTLTTEQQQFVAEQLRSGNFQSADEVIAQSLGMLQAQEAFIPANVPELRKKIAHGMKQLKRGETIDGKTVVKNLQEKSNQHQRNEP